MSSLEALAWCQSNFVGVIFMPNGCRIIWSKLALGSVEARDFLSAVILAKTEHAASTQVKESEGVHDKRD